MIEQHTRILQQQRDALETMRQQSQDRRTALANRSPGRHRKMENGSHSFEVSPYFGQYQLESDQL